jgi:O-acetyl-ADP-ribose deacetylase (regulator of RNase III)
MSELTIIKGDATAPVAEGNKLIVHICNDIGGWGKGFVMALSRRWKEPESQYRKWYQSGTDFGLGKVQFVKVEDDIWVANMVAQHDIRKGRDGVPPIRYEAVEECLQEVYTWAKEHHASVHMPKIGAGLAGGDWGKISGIIEEVLCRRGVGVTVYEL